MRKVVEELKLILQKELDVYSQLIALGLDKRKVLLGKFSPDLQEIVSKEEVLVQELFEIEPSRKDCCGVIAGDENAKIENVISFLSDDEEKAEILSISDSLRKKVLEIGEINKQNQALVEQALELTRYSVNLVTKAPKAVTYGRGGQMGSGTPKNSSSFLNLKA